MFNKLNLINKKPKPFEFYTTPLLWNDEYVSKKMLEFHLNREVDAASRNHTFIDKAVDWMVQRFNIKEGFKICDFGCGPGLYSTRLAEKGAQVTGIDLSERSINYARETAEKKNLDINYILSNYLDYEPEEKFDLVAMIYYDFGVLSPQQRKKMLGIFRKALKDDGFVVIDVFNHNHYNQAKEALSLDYSPGNSEPGDIFVIKDSGNIFEGFWTSEPCYTFHSNIKYEEEKLILDKWTIIEENREREIYNWNQCYSSEILAKLFNENGFEIIEEYLNITGEKLTPQGNEMAVVARKLL